MTKVFKNEVLNSSDSILKKLRTLLEGDPEGFDVAFDKFFRLDDNKNLIPPFSN